MEFQPIWEPDCFQLTPNMWYVVSPTDGNFPSPRVGHSLVTTGNSIFVIGGASSQDGLLNDVYELNISVYKWIKHDIKGSFAPRYEHTCFTVPSVYPSRFYIFGGCGNEGNLNDVSYVDLLEANPEWKCASVSGNAPSPRSCRGSAVSIDHYFYVWAGGLQGSEPVSDPSMYQLNVLDNTWKVCCDGTNAPSVRQGHTLTCSKDNIYMFGGLAGDVFYNDVYMWNLKSGWRKLSTSNNPSPRAGHASILLGNGCMAFIGGIDKSMSALQETWIFNPCTLVWSQLSYSGESLQPRLDHAITFFPAQNKTLSDYSENIGSTAIMKRGSSLPLRPINNQQNSPKKIIDITDQFTPSPSITDSFQTPSSESSTAISDASSSLISPSPPDPSLNQILVFGGMDTVGNVFDDALLIHIIQ